MEVCTKFNLMDKVWTFGTGVENRTLIQVQIEIVTVDFNINNDGDIEPQVTYKVSTPAYGDDVFLGENEVYRDFEDFTKSMETTFQQRKYKFPKMLNDIQEQTKEVA